MKAMLLTAGVGERLYPLTLSQPKPALPVLGRPLVVQILSWLGRRGVDEAVLNLHHLPDELKRVVGEGHCSGLPVVRYSPEEVIQGTAGGLRQAAAWLRGGEPIVVCNSDFLSDIDLEAVVEAHRSSGMQATLVLAPQRPGYSVVAVDDRGAVLSLAGLPEAEPSAVAGEYLFTGCHVIEEEVLDLIPQRGPSDIVRDVYRGMAADGRLGSFLHDGFWWEFGTPELYLEGCLRLLDHPLDELRGISTERDAIRRLGEADVAVGPGAEYAESSRFVGRAALGYSCRVGDDVRIEDSIVMPEAWIGPGCRLTRSVVAQDVELPAGFDCIDRLVCNDPDPDRPVPSSTRRVSGMLICSLTRPGPR